MSRRERGSSTTPWVLALLPAIAAACLGKTEALPPHGEVLVVVDTDLPVPQLASRLRVDLYAEDGRWIESRDIGRSDPRDWPASFSVFSDDDTRPVRVLVRLRAYADGVVRDYLGERFATREAYAPLKTASSLAELCASAPDLAIGSRITLRRGGVPITDVAPGGTCVGPTRDGSVAARVTIPSAGAYRFYVANAVPYESTSALLLRRQCDDPTSQLACLDASDLSLVDVAVDGHFPRFEATLEPGTYWLMTAGTAGDWPADITLAVDAVDATGSEPPSQPTASVTANQPRLLTTETPPRDVTPTTEPLPTATVDRLVLLELAPAARSTARVVLRGVCAGTMSRLGSDPVRPDPKTAETCVDTEAVRVPVAIEPLAPFAPAPTESLRGTFAPLTGCDGASSDPASSPVCVPGGAFLLGGRTQVYTTVEMQPSPERLTVVSPFWMDRWEVSVGRLRAAVSRGLVLGAQAVAVNDASLESVRDDSERLCTWSSAPMGREDLPVNCIAWSAAQAFCRFEGGDLPTEAQWEYAALAAGRPFKTLYPWGNEEPTCERAAFGQQSVFIEPPYACLDETTVKGPEPVAAHDGRDGRPGDVTPLGLVGLAGNVNEHVRDAAGSYAGACWSTAPLRDPSCIEDDAPRHAVRGFSWLSPPSPLVVRGGVPTGFGGERAPFAANMFLGFRCTYREKKP